MVTDIRSLRPYDPISRTAAMILAGAPPSLAVTNEHGVVGVVTRHHLVRGLQMGKPDTPVAEIMSTQVEVTDAAAPLDRAVERARSGTAILVERDRELVGLLSQETPPAGPARLPLLPLRQSPASGTEDILVQPSGRGRHDVCLAIERNEPLQEVIHGGSRADSQAATRDIDPLPLIEQEISSPGATSGVPSRTFGLLLGLFTRKIEFFPNVEVVDSEKTIEIAGPEQGDTGQGRIARNLMRHWFAEHTGEVELHLEAATLEELFAEAGRALAELLADEPRPASGDPETVLVRAPDRETLLVEWLNELLFLSETRKQVFSEVHVDGIANGELRARVRGFEPGSIRTAVKAATLHQLRIEERPGGFAATVVLDV